MSHPTINFVSSTFFTTKWIGSLTIGAYPYFSDTIPATEKEKVLAHKIYWDCSDTQYIGCILRKDQQDQVLKEISRYLNNEFVKTELIHSSPDFTNLGYVGTEEVLESEHGNNYLNFFIYKVTYNV